MKACALTVRALLSGVGLILGVSCACPQAHTGLRYSGTGSASGKPQAERSPTQILHGLASYYHDSLAGNTTANGEVYDPTELTAASRDLPFGTIVRVTRLDNGRHVEVRVNDRGPFRDHRRILDLSRAAAERLDMIQAGVVSIRAEIFPRTY